MRKGSEEAQPLLQTGFPDPTRPEDRDKPPPFSF